jgi:transposase
MPNHPPHAVRGAATIATTRRARTAAATGLPIRVPSFVTLSKTIRANRDRVLAAVELGLSNSKLEGLNSKIRLINHRGYGHHSAAALIAMIYLCCGGITVELPTER